MSSRPTRGHRSVALAGVALAALMPAAAIAQSPSPEPVPEGAITVYSGRNEGLVGPIVARFTEVTGIPAVVDYGGTTAKTAQILEEGSASPADVFFSQDAGALQELVSAGLLAPLADETLALVPEGYRAADGTWIGASGRARVAAYSTERLTADQLPGSILEFTDPAWKGRIGWAPTNASLLSHVTAMRSALGEDAARAWLEGIKANEAKVYEGNTQAVEGVANGEVDVALVNHYYLWNLSAAAEAAGETFPVANHYFDAGDIGALVNIAGLGILASTDQPTEAAAFVDFLLSPEAQTYFAERTHEYPLVEGIPTTEGLVPLADLGAPPVGLDQLEDLAGTLALMRELELID
ncbi:MAG: iron ABC transporter substrate-binding protein [Chloroflexi bacterium]|nr:iron ABC transporter substrate-binding protein [Chloroflexota bacterium]